MSSCNNLNQMIDSFNSTATTNSTNSTSHSPTNSNDNKYINDYIILICKINNAQLVLVPPIKIYVPYDYPQSNPFVELLQLDDMDDDMLPDYSKSI